MSPEEFREHGHRVVDWMAEYLAHPERHKVLPHIAPGELTDSLPSRGPETGEPMSGILADFDRQLMPAMTHWNHPGFMAFFAVSSTGPGILAEMMTAALNVNGMLWKSSPAATELEQVTLEWLRDWMGLPPGLFGIIFDTASVSTMHAIAAARQAADKETRTKGARRGLILYTSEMAHSSVEKGAFSLGIGQENIRKISVDSEFRMRPDRLRKGIQQDLDAGLRPFCVVPTVGTTSVTSIDPVPAIAAICEEFHLWMHVDAAYGGSAAIVPEMRQFLDGCHRADSLVVNPHKWMGMPLDLSVLYTCHPETFRETYALVPDYLRFSENPRAVNFMDYGVPLGRRFRALKLWFAMRYFGREGLAERIRNHVCWAQELARQIATDPMFEVCAPTPMSLVCFRHKGSDAQNQALLEAVNSSGEAFLSHTILNGKFVLRMAIGNFATTRDYVQRIWQIIKECALDLA